jgi:hypothetical protein
LAKAGLTNDGERWSIQSFFRVSCRIPLAFSIPTGLHHSFGGKNEEQTTVTVILLCCVLSLSASTALADTVSLTLSDPNSAIAGFTGPYATATIHLTSATTANITFASLTNGGDIYLFGDGSSVDLNVNATSFTLNSISGSNAGSGFTPGPFSNSAGNVDGFGFFNLTISSFDHSFQ